MSKVPSPGLGLGTTAHAEPFQCSISVLSAPPSDRYPTVHASQPESTATLCSEFVLVPGLRGGSPVQFRHVADAEVVADADVDDVAETARVSADAIAQARPARRRDADMACSISSSMFQQQCRAMGSITVPLT
jgi:hypothetical protein